MKKLIGATLLLTLLGVLLGNWMNQMNDKNIYYIDREDGRKKVESVYGDFFLRFLYQNSLGKKLIPLFIKKWFSKFYGLLQDTSWSQRKIKPFIKKFSINMDEFLPTDGRALRDPYASFNEFFIRRFKLGKRAFPKEANIMGAFAEARYYGYNEINEETKVPVKGQFLTPEQLIENPKWGELFKGGSLLLARLCPVDYHRFHFPDSGTIVDSWRRKGELHSVNPVAIKEYPELFCLNERHISIIETEKFGHLAYIEVGAMGVGKIVQTHSNKFNKGDEKGYFLFGGSTVIVIGEKGKWLPSEDIVQNTKSGIETYIKLGDSIARTPTPTPTPNSKTNGDS